MFIITTYALHYNCHFYAVVSWIKDNNSLYIYTYVNMYWINKKAKMCEYNKKNVSI